MSIQTKDFVIEYSEITLREIAKQYNIMAEEGWQTLEDWRTACYSAANTNISPRVINYWMESGLFQGTRKDGQGWHKFTLMDIVFIAIASRLRGIGIALRQIKETYKTLFEPILPVDMMTDLDPERHGLTMLEFGFMRAISINGDGNTYLLMASNGSAGIMTMRDLLYNQERGNIPDIYIFLNLNEVLNDTFINRVIHKHPENMRWLNRGERNVFDEIQKSNEQRDITIKFSGGSVDTITTKQRVKTEEELHKVMNDISHGKIEIGVENGKRQYVTKNETKKVRK